MQASKNTILLFLSAMILVIAYLSWHAAKSTRKPRSSQSGASLTVSRSAGTFTRSVLQTGTPIQRAASPATAQDAVEVPSSLTDGFRKDLPADATARLTAQLGAAAWEAERKSILARVETLSLSQAAEEITHVMPSAAFTGSSSMPLDFREYQVALLSDPRIAKVCAAAIHGSSQDRDFLRDFIHKDIHEYLDAVVRHRDGDTLAADLAMREIGLDAYPFLLTSLDDQGRSLSLLVEWYQVESSGVQGYAEIPRNQLEAYFASAGIELPKEDEVVGHAPSTQRMELVSAAVYEINRRAGSPIECEFEVDEAVFLGNERIPGPKGPVEDLVGQSLLPGLTSPQREILMTSASDYFDIQR